MLGDRLRMHKVSVTLVAVAVTRESLVLLLEVTHSVSSIMC